MPAPINVLFAHYGDEWIRGSETLLLDLLRALDRKLVRPFVWCNSDAMAAAARGVDCWTLRSDFSHAFDYSSPRPSLLRYRELVRTCRVLCREQRIHVLHSNSAAPAQWLVPVGFSERLPVVAHLHIEYLRRSRYVLLLHMATRVVGVSSQVNEGVIADGIAPERTRVIYNGIDFARLSRSPNNLRDRLGIPPDAFVVATAGSLIERKGHDVLLRAFTALPRRAHLLIPSDGPSRAALQALATLLGVAGRVHFLGYVENIVQLYEAADLFALASRGDAFGLVLAEAGYFGLPSVATRVGGIPEVVAHDETGVLVPPDDVAALSKALVQLLGDPALRKRMGDAANARVSRLFTVERMARQFEEIYAELSAIPAARLGWSSSLRRLRPYGKLLAATGNWPGRR